MPLRGRKGITVLELILVIAMMTMTIAIGLPIVGDYYSTEQLNSATNQIVQSLHWAQNKTLTGENGSQFGVWFDENNKRYILFSGGTYDPQADYLFPQSYNPAITVDMSKIYSSEVIFQRLTGQTLNYGQIEVWLGEKHRIIDILGTGRIEIIE